ncbi:MAG: c-type cytochrome [Verrucomicrobiaceae bacterium]|nr:MAG: c-type cytochrome [Verrucomicrobiaceae bacterium]
MKLTCILSLITILAASNQKALAGLRAGAAQVDVTPRKLPVTVNGGFLTNKVRIIADRLHSRAIVFSDDDQTIAIAVVDSCMIPTHLCDTVKEKVFKQTGIKKDKILICATHTHSAPSVMDLCLGTDKDEDYTKFLPDKIAESIFKAHSSLRPAKAGWSVFDGSDYTKPRRWAFWPGTGTDPFGEKSIRANMHPGYQNPNATGETGPTDPWFTLFSLVSEDDEPIAVLGNFSMHYFSGHSGISSDYFGRYCKELSARIGEGSIVALSQGTSGDVWRADYGKGREESEISIKRYVKELTDLSVKSLSTIKYSSDLPVSMKEKRIVMNRRAPDKDRLEWAQKVSQGIKNNIPRSKAQVYARQALYLHDNPNTEVVLQAIRVGDFGITTMPNEVYALTGLKLKSWSPLGTTMNIELANGAEGYIPPAEQHFLGGYTTWPSVTAGLEIGAEKKITSHLIGMLENISGKPKKAYHEALGKYAEAINVLNPVKQWRLGDIEPGKGFEGGVVCHLPGVESKGFPDNHRSRSANFAGGRIASEAKIGDQYSISLWFRNGLRKDARLVTGYFFSRGDPDNNDVPGDHLGIGGTAGHAGKLIIFNGNESNDLLAGKQDLIKGRWYHLVFVRNQKQVRAYINGKQEMAGELEPTHSGSNDFFIGGRSDQFANFEGRIDEVAFFDRALSAVEVGALYETAGIIPVPDSPPLLPAQSLKKTHVPKGYKVELVASEPLVMDPVAIDWSSDGSVWVAEMADYPSGENGVLGRIAKLIDTNGDHRPDKRQVLLDDVSFPTGVMSWGDGVIVTCAGKIFYAEDEDGDGMADRKEDWFTGFIENNQQLRVNGLRWGLDDWIYCASGGHHAGFGVNTIITCAKNGKKIKLGARDFRFRPDGSFEPVAGPSQFGRVRDNEGNWFGVQNAHPIWHYVLEDQYLKRNPDIAAPDPRKMLRGKSPKIYSAGKAQKRFHGFDMIGRYTSACGISIYRDNILFDHSSDQISAFTCEPFSNLVQRHILNDQGATFTAERAEDGDHDFFASEDRWCRPVMSRTAPDGSLWVVDMYRYMIEHPQWLPPEGKQELKPHYYSGQGKGRIYRISKKGSEHDWRVAIKNSPNGIARDIALRESFRKGESILWDKQEIMDGLISKERSVRKIALRKSERLEEIIPEIFALANDPDSKVRLQAAYTFGEFESDEAGQALSKIAQRDGEDPYFAAAILSSSAPHFTTLVSSGKLSSLITQGLLKMAHRFPGMGEKISEEILVNWSGPEKWRLLASAPSVFRERARAAAVTAANDAELSSEERALAVRLLGKENMEEMMKLLSSANSKEIQLATLKHLGTLGSFVSILDSWPVLGPAAREVAENALLSKEQGTDALLERIESRKINAVELSPISLGRIKEHSSSKIRERAKKALSKSISGDRNEVIARYRPSVSMQGDHANGKKHFIARCSNCHKVDAIGQDFGPDLKTISNRSPESLLISILAPSASIEPRYLAYSADLKDENIYGLVQAETSNSIIMQLVDGTKRVLNRNDILSLKGTGKSIMPEGLEAGLSLQDFADLLSYLSKELVSN